MKFLIQRDSHYYLKATFQAETLNNIVIEY